MELGEEMRDYRARMKREGLDKPTDRVFRKKRTREPQTRRNAEARLKYAIRQANERLEQLGIDQISEKASPHSLRRCYASVRFGLGDNPRTVMEQLGHTEATFSLSIYAKALSRRERLSAHAAEFDECMEWARIGAQADPDTAFAQERTRFLEPSAS